MIGVIRFTLILDVTFFYNRTEIENTSVTVEVIGMIRFSFILDVTFFYDRTEIENTSVIIEIENQV